MKMTNYPCEEVIVMARPARSSPLKIVTAPSLTSEHYPIKLSKLLARLIPLGITAEILTFRDFQIGGVRG